VGGDEAANRSQAFWVLRVAADAPAAGRDQVAIEDAPFLSSSLYEDWGHERAQGFDRCPERAGMDVFHVPTGQRFPAACNTYRCARCGPMKAYGYGQLAAASRPERMLTFTALSGEWQQNRERVKTLVHSLRRLGYRVQLFWAVEENPKGTGWHVHAVQHGDYVPWKVLLRLWDARVKIERIRVTVEASRYVIKGAAAANYVTKGTTTDLDAHRARNGGRAAHWSRGFMRLENGEPQTATALRAALGLSSLSGEWLMVPAHTVLTREHVRRLHAAQLVHRRAMS
jgi:hypothetical protein